ncbi:MAG: hypothetical protein ABI778_10200, partial [Ignavibacteriota bacterium]
HFARAFYAKLSYTKIRKFIHCQSLIGCNWYIVGYFFNISGGLIIMGMIDQIPMSIGEVTVVLSKHAEAITKGSCRLADSIRNKGISTLLVNCGISRPRFEEAAPKADVRILEGEDGQIIAMDGMPCEYLKFEDDEDPKVVRARPHLVVVHSTRGDLVNEMNDLDEIIYECRVGVVIISGWEWASDSWRKRERLLFALRRMAEEREVAIVIYSQATTSPIAGCFDRGGIGKLAMLAYEIVTYKSTEKLKKVFSQNPPLPQTPEDLREAERSAQLLASKINDLQEVNSDSTAALPRMKIQNPWTPSAADKKPIPSEALEKEKVKSA